MSRGNVCELWAPAAGNVEEAIFAVQKQQPFWRIPRFEVTMERLLGGEFSARFHPLEGVRGEAEIGVFFWVRKLWPFSEKLVVAVYSYKGCKLV